MKTMSLVLLVVTLCGYAQAAELNEGKTITCSVSSSADTGKSKSFTEDELVEGQIVKFESSHVYIGAKKQPAGYWRGLIQINSYETGRPVTTNYFNLVDLMDYSANMPGGAHVSADCYVK